MASKTIRDLEAQLVIREERLASIREEYDTALADVDALRRSLEIMKSVEESDDSEDAQPTKVVRNAMVEILRDAGKPLHYGEILNRLNERGIAVSGRDPKKNVSAHLSNDERFEKQGNGNWALASWRVPAPQRASLRDRIRDAEAVVAGMSGNPQDEENEYDQLEREVHETELADELAARYAITGRYNDDVPF